MRGSLLQAVICSRPLETSIRRGRVLTELKSDVVFARVDVLRANVFEEANVCCDHKYSSRLMTNSPRIT